MAQLIVRHLEDGVKRQLERRARRHGKSMEEEVRDILRNAVRTERRASKEGLGTRIARLCAALDFPEVVEWRGYHARPAKLTARRR